VFSWYTYCIARKRNKWLKTPILGHLCNRWDSPLARPLTAPIFENKPLWHFVSLPFMWFVTVHSSFHHSMNTSMNARLILLTCLLLTHPDICTLACSFGSMLVSLCIHMSLHALSLCTYKNTPGVHDWRHWCQVLQGGCAHDYWGKLTCIYIYLYICKYVCALKEVVRVDFDVLFVICIYSYSYNHPWIYAQPCGHVCVCVITEIRWGFINACQAQQVWFLWKCENKKLREPLYFSTWTCYMCPQQYMSSILPFTATRQDCW